MLTNGCLRLEGYFPKTTCLLNECCTMIGSCVHFTFTSLIAHFVCEYMARSPWRWHVRKYDCQLRTCYTSVGECNVTWRSKVCDEAQLVVEKRRSCHRHNTSWNSGCVHSKCVKYLIVDKERLVLLLFNNNTQCNTLFAMCRSRPKWLHWCGWTSNI